MVARLPDRLRDRLVLSQSGAAAQIIQAFSARLGVLSTSSGLCLGLFKRQVSSATDH